MARLKVSHCGEDEDEDDADADVIEAVAGFYSRRSLFCVLAKVCSSRGFAAVRSKDGQGTKDALASRGPWSDHGLLFSHLFSRPTERA